VLSDFKNSPETANYETVTTVDGFEDPTLLGVAHRMYWWFPTHFFKFQDALLRWEENSQQKDKIFLLGRPQITFIDLGCGAGAASAAILSILEQYQSFLVSQSIRIDLINVNFIGVDPCQPELDIYTKLLTEYSLHIKPYKINVTIQTICQPFPEATDNLIEQLNCYSGHILIVGMSNLINWIWNEADQYLKQRKHDSLKALESQEVEALKNLAIKTNFEILYVLGIATKTRKRQWLSEKLSMLLERFLQVLAFWKRTFTSFWKLDAEVVFENPEGSRRSKEKAIASSRFFVETITDISPEFIKDKRYQDLLSLKSLERAWVKAQTWINYEALVDRVELKLFEIDYPMELERLRTACLEKFFEYLNINFDFPYAFPKNEIVNRPKSLARLEEQIIAIALVIEFEKELMEGLKNISFSFCLTRHDSEFLYQYWFELYSRFIESVLNNFGDNKMLSTDLKSYYVNINQSKLLDILAERLAFSKLSYNIISRIVGRPCHAEHDIGYGILQGHSISGVLANLALQPIDIKYVANHGMWNRYFRFTDDVAITRIKSDTRPLDTQELIDYRNILSEYDIKLSVNEGKTREYKSQSDFENKVRAHRDMDGLSARFNKLLLPLFVMNDDYRHEFNRSSLHFVYEYHELLECLGLYVSPEWLFRKIDEYTNPLKFFRSVYKIFIGKYSIKLPPLPANSSTPTKVSWAKEFEKLNGNWVAEKDVVKNMLSAMFNSSVLTIMNENENEDVDTTNYARKIKFSSNRLSIFGGGDTANQTSWMLINRPWDINVWLACKNLGRSKMDKEIAYIIDHARMSYVCALAIKALGAVRTNLAAQKIVTVLNNSNESIERLMASEALLEINLWNDITHEDIMSWMEKDCVEPYLHKNIILILAQAYPDRLHEYLATLTEHLRPVVNRAVHYAKTKSPSDVLLWRPEPEVIRSYRAKSYPVIEELIQEEGSYKFGSP
jgi:hypothetical protein